MALTRSGVLVRIELYATGAAAPEDTWAVVGTPWRWPDWTDADRVEDVAPEPVEVGTQVSVAVDDRRLDWRVAAIAPRLLEATTDTERGPLSIGVRVVRERDGSRLVLAAAYEPSGRATTWRVRLLDAPALRRRFDRWTRRALELAAAER